MKSILIYFSILILLFIGIYIGVNNNKKINKSYSNEAVYKDEKLSYYNNEYKKRYEKFANKYKDLSFSDVVTRVNLSLDRKDYNDTKPTPYQDKTYILVNKHIYMDKDYVPNNLEKLDTSYARSGMMLVKEAKDSLEKMVNDAKKDGFTIRVMSSYRSYNYQVNLYNKYKEIDGEEKADTYSARPGYSEHQTGLCIDVDDKIVSYTDFENSETFTWMQKNAHNYGFILRYPEDKTDITRYQYESWHYRYVGKEIATYIKKHNITFDEYYVRFIENKR